MKMKHYLTAYDRETDELLSFSLSVPGIYLERVKAIAQVAQTDPEAVGSYPLDAEQVREIAKLLDRPPPTDLGAAFYLEPARIA